jgi:serine/threonine-protein kinase HipA
MTDTLNVLHDDQLVGEIRQLKDHRLEFSYDEAWRHATTSTPLSLSMPLAERRHRDEAISNFLWGLLPDNERVIARWARDFQVSARSVFGLLTNIGGDVAGAMQFLAPDHVGRAPGHLIPLSDHEIAQLIAEIRKDGSAWHPTGRNGRWSLAGAQGKIALHFDPVGQRWADPSGEFATTHILKPAIEGNVDHDLNEHLCLTAARLLGLPTARSEIQDFLGERVTVVERYDRRWYDGRLRRVHQEDMCQAMGLPPQRKYQVDGGPSAADIANLLRFERPSSAQRDIETFARALMFNWLIVGTDAHAKNYSVLLRGNQARLAPLYDLASGLLLGEHVRKLRLAMKIGGEYASFKLERRHWVQLADDFGIDGDALIDAGRDLAARLPDALASAANSPAIEAIGSRTPTTLVDRAAEWCRSCTGVLNRR